MSKQALTDNSKTVVFQSLEEFIAAQVDLWPGDTARIGTAEYTLNSDGTVTSKVA